MIRSDQISVAVVRLTIEGYDMPVFIDRIGSDWTGAYAGLGPNLDTQANIDPSPTPALGAWPKPGLPKTCKA